MNQAEKQTIQTSIGLGSMVMESTPPNSPTKKNALATKDGQHGSPQRPSFHRRDTVVRTNGRKRSPQPTVLQTCLRRGEADEDLEPPLTPPTRRKKNSVVATTPTTTTTTTTTKTTRRQLVEF